jgi:membrane-bound lytic murein transglycosylase B
MLKKTMKILLKIFCFIILFNHSALAKQANDFNNWISSFKSRALKEGIKEQTFDAAFKNVKFLERLLIYDKRQPEFIETTSVYVGKRVTNQKVLKAKKFIEENEKLLTKISTEFKVPKEYLLALWGVETNFGVHKGKVNTVSALATLSFDKRRSEYFSKELIILLKLLDTKKISYNSLFGSWAGAHGNFQFMPSSIKNYAIDYDKDGTIDLVNSLEDSFASAANYLSKIGWNSNYPWGQEIVSSKQIDPNIITTDARKLKNSYTKSKWKKLGISNEILFKSKTKLRLVRPDGSTGPLFLVSSNYEKLLHWNRSLRFAISIGIFADKIKNEI